MAMRKKFSVSENYSSSGYFSVFRSSEWLKMREDMKNRDKKSTTGVCRKWALIICLILFGSAILIAICKVLYNETYVWQSTELVKYLVPSKRGTCFEVPKIEVQSVNKIGLLYVFDDEDGSWSSELMERVMNNRRKYCDLHGYSLLNGNKYIDHSRPVAWSKLLAIKSYLCDYEYIIYMDMDAVIMNFDRKIQDFIALDQQIRSTLDPPRSGSDIIMTEDWRGPNTGVWIAKNTSFTKWFLQSAWTLGAQFAIKNQPTILSRGKPRLPFEYEQRVFHYFLGTKAWRDRQLPYYLPNPGAGYPYTTEDIRSHFGYLPQCTFNSYSLHPLALRGDRETSHYVPGDFLVHLAGKKRQTRTDLLQHYLSLAGQ
jgi:hypothetical protein